MKIVIILTTILMLSGCSKVRYHEVDQAIQYCEDKGGLVEIYEIFGPPWKVRCLDGSKSSLLRHKR